MERTIRRSTMILAAAALLATARVGVLHAEAADKGGPHAMAAASPRGVWVFLGAAIPKNEPYVVTRAGGGESLGKISAPSSRDELARRVLQFAPYFDGLARPNDDDINQLWEYAQSHDDVAHLIVQNIPVAHLALGTAVLDTAAAAAPRGTEFRYRIERAGATVETRPVTWPSTSTMPAPATGGSPGGRFDGTHVQVQWRVPRGTEPAGVIVRRRVAMKGDFARVPVTSGFRAGNDTISVVVRDDHVEPNAVYEYTAVLVDRLANPGAQSAPVRVLTFPAGGVPVVRALHAQGLGDGHRVRLQWELLGQSYVRSIEIERGPTFDGPFERIATLPPDTREFVDVVPAANENTYYRIVTAGAAETSTSAVVAAMAMEGEVPLPPHRVRAQSAKRGIQVSWEGVGPHIVGYYVYRSTGGRDWKQVSALVPPDSGVVTFVDTSRVLDGRETYSYAIRAVGDGYALGELSPAASASPPVDYTLSAPVNLRAVPEADRVRLFWDDLQEREPTLAGYAVYRRHGSEKEFEMVYGAASYSPRINYWTDSTVTAGETYEYAVGAIDVHGVQSAMSAPLAVRVPAAPSIAAPSGVRAVVTSEGIHVSWASILDDRVAGYRIYRRAPGEQAAVVARPGRDEVAWTDRTARKGTTYVYVVTAIGSDGSEGAPSDPVSAYR
jgi:fibronectin type 3 domain-containing protein